MSDRHHDQQRLRVRIAAGTAVVVHALVLVAVLATRSGEQRATTAQSPALVEPTESIEVTVGEPNESANPNPNPNANASASPRDTVAMGSAGRGVPGPAARAPVESETPHAAPSASPAAPAGSSAPVILFNPAPNGLPLVALGPNPLLGNGREGGAAAPAPAPGSSTFQSAAPGPPSRAEAKRAAEQALKNGVAERDGALGLGPDGPVISALHEATRNSLAPERGSATFRVVIDSAGLVVSLRLVGSTGGGDGWNDARDRAARSLAARKLTLRGGKGAELTIVVESDVVLPSGSKAPIRPALKDSQVTLPENVPGGGTANVTKTHTVAEFDVADVGSKPRRVIHARVISVSTL